MSVTNFDNDVSFNASANLPPSGFSSSGSYSPLVNVGSTVFTTNTLGHPSKWTGIAGGTNYLGLGYWESSSGYSSSTMIMDKNIITSIESSNYSDIYSANGSGIGSTIETIMGVGSLDMHSISATSSPVGGVDTGFYNSSATKSFVNIIPDNVQIGYSTIVQGVMETTLASITVQSTGISTIGALSLDNGKITTDGAGKLGIAKGLTVGWGSSISLPSSDGKTTYTITNNGSAVVFNGTITTTGGLSSDNNAIYSNGTGILTVNSVLAIRGESHFARGSYSDPDSGGIRDAKFGSNGIAVIGGIKTDTINVTGTVALSGGNVTMDTSGNITVHNNSYSTAGQYLEFITHSADANNVSIRMFWQCNDGVDHLGKKLTGNRFHFHNMKYGTEYEMHGNLYTGEVHCNNIYTVDITSTGTLNLDNGKFTSDGKGNIVANSVSASSSFNFPHCVYSALPSSSTLGSAMFVSNALKPGEAHGSGTGCLCVFDGLNWMNISTGTKVTI